MERSLRKAWLRFGAALPLVGSIGACTVEIPSGVFACEQSTDCPRSFVCRPEHTGDDDMFCFDDASEPSLPACSGESPAGEPCAPRNATSCGRLDDGCGDGTSCCATTLVPAGEFYRSYDESMDPEQDGKPVAGWEAPFGDPISVDAFALDVYEVTVARFQAFAADYDQWILSNPVPGSGGRAPGTEWRYAYRSEWPMPASGRQMIDAIEMCPDSVLRDESRGDTSAMPINCLTWVEAYLFCTWDGGRLPTEAEWNYAAAGGDQQRPFPWTEAPFVGTEGARSKAVISAPGGSLDVGSHPEGAGRWGHHDLAGNVWEWVFDADEAESTNFTPMSYGACAASTGEGCVATDGPARLFRGGSFKFGEAEARTAFRIGTLQDTRYSDLGARCARDF